MEGNPPKPYLDDHPPCDQKSTELFAKGLRFAGFSMEIILLDTGFLLGP